MRTTHIKNIREACVSANPEIMELKFGCRFKFPSDKYGVFLNDKEWKKAKFLVDLPLLAPHYDELFWDDMVDVEILGRPIRLADILLATEQKWVTFYSASLSSFGKKTKSEGAVLYQIIQKWNLRKDSLEDQSDECVAFISSLLTTK